VEAATLLIELGAVLLLLAGAARLAFRTGLSAIPLYLLIGLSLGNGGLYPLVTAEAFIEAGAHIGVILLLFMLGLEYTPEELFGGLRTGASTAALDLVANFGPGLIAGLLLGWTPLAAVVLGGVTYISSSGIVAKVVDDLGWMANRETPLVLSLLVAEDLVMAVYLPLLGAFLVGGSALAIGASMAVALGTAAATLLLAARAGPAISRVLETPSREALLLTALGVTLLVAGIAEELHISAAVGAFLVGIAFSGSLQHRAAEIMLPLRDLFAATFFVFFGLQIDPGELPAALLVASGLAVVTAATKFGTAWWGARRLGIGPRGRRRAGSVLLARGEFSIVIAEIGVASGLEPAIGPLAAAYVLLLAITGPVAARLVRT
jgi:CPA2 family monovalent cation:H+ antiporter-2